jgi:hypothetical protein
MASGSPLFAACAERRLPQDCRDSILTFLTIQECLTYGSTSKAILLDILPDLQRRRREQFLFRYGYQTKNPYTLKPILPKNGNNYSDEEKGSVLSESSGQGSDIHILPSITERMQALFRMLPSSHPFNGDLRELALDLRQEVRKEHPTTTDSFVSSLLQLQQVTKAHRLHSSMLYRCTIGISRPRRPGDEQRYSPRATAESPTGILTVSLEHYIGDALCACYFMGHASTGVLDGGLVTHKQWVAHLMSELRRQTDDDIRTCNALTWYQLWVYLHSTFLRCFPFTPDQQEQLLGLSSGICGRTLHDNNDTMAFVHPHFPYALGNFTHLARFLDHYDDNFPAPAVHCTTLNDFGPLGPAFRGRDSIRTIRMDPQFVMSEFAHYWWPVSSGQSTFSVWPRLVEHGLAPYRYDPLLGRWLTGRNPVIPWMMQLHQACRQNRPMTVEAPLVTIEVRNHE